jgi:DNA processing protein
MNEDIGIRYKDWLDKYFWIWLFLQEGVGSQFVVKLRHSLLMRRLNWYKLRRIIQAKKNVAVCNRLKIEQEVKKFCKKIKDESIRIVPFWGSKFPFLLKQIPDPPAFLFCKGDLDFMKLPAVAIVGTRSVSAYGREVVDLIVDPLADVGVTIVSGLAQGLDGLVHRRLLEVGGERAIAVLPGGPLTGFPMRNRSLYDDIVQKGLVVSEYYPGVAISRGMFASRNRIIAALSRLTVVIEAPQKSGALITADVALQYNREVGAVPGSILSNTSKGTNHLIKDGAHVIRSGFDILEILNSLGVVGNLKEQTEEKHRDDGVDAETFGEKTYLCRRLRKTFGLSRETNAEIADALYDPGMSLEDLRESLRTSPSSVRAFLTRMEIRGILSRESAGLIKLVRK